MTGFEIGVDEAGKGPVLGPMVAAAVRADAEALPEGITDSKRLSAATRESLAERLSSSPAVEIGVGIVTTDEIDDPETDMNRLTVAAQVRALTAVVADGDHVIVDAGEVSESRFGRRVREGVENEAIEIDVTAEHGADDSHHIVGAASIIAKVERDRRMRAIAADYEGYRPLGSGYPSDPKTRAFLVTYVEAHGEIPPCARRSWSTCDDLLTAQKQASLSEF